jgi:hypothetical protein
MPRRHWERERQARDPSLRAPIGQADPAAIPPVAKVTALESLQCAELGAVGPQSVSSRPRREGVAVNVILLGRVLVSASAKTLSFRPRTLLGH